MSIRVFEGSDVSGVIERFGDAHSMAVFVGAGASVEAGLPTWETLVERLLWRAAEVENLFEDSGHCAAWIESTLRVESLSGAASIAEGLLGDGLTAATRDALFGGDDRPSTRGLPATRSAESYWPGQVALQLANLRMAFDDDHRELAIYTTNYDDLLEEALRQRSELTDHYAIEPYVGPAAGRDKAVIEVKHLHGFLGRHDDTQGELVLTERSMFRDSRKDQWRTDEVRSQLSRTPCLFLGTSLTDVNIVRYLYEQNGPNRHTVVFVRQAEIYGVPDSVREVREMVAKRRWASDDVEVIFLDHYCDVAQLVHEIAKRRSSPKRYVPLPQRKREYMEALETHALRPIGSDTQVFRSRQDHLNGTLSEVLKEVIDAMKIDHVDLSKEDGLALALWLIDPAGDKLTAWATSDRIHTTLHGVQTAPLATQTRWTSVAAYTTGQCQFYEPPSANSRWSFIAGVPLWTQPDSPFGRIPIGALTVSTQTPLEHTALVHVTKHQVVFAAILAEGVLKRLNKLREP